MRGRSEGAERARLRRDDLVVSGRGTYMLFPAGLSSVGASLHDELFAPLRWVLGGRPRGALTGGTAGNFPVPALRDRVGETTAAAAAMRESPELPCSSTLLIGASA